MKRYQKRIFRAYSYIAAVLLLVSFIIFFALGGFKTQPSNQLANNTPTQTATDTLAPTLASTIAPTIAPTVTPTSEVGPVTLTFAGDIALPDDTILKSALTANETYSFSKYFSSITPFIKGDINLVNLNGPVTTDGTNISGYPIANYPIDIVSAIKQTGLSLVVTANDRLNDKSKVGIDNTNYKVKIAGLESIGTYSSEDEYNTPYIKTVKGIKIGFVAYTDSINIPLPSNNLSAARLINWTAYPDTVAKVKADIAQLRQNGAEIVVLAMHWGTLYADTANKQQRDLAQDAINAGADIIYGTGTSCVEPITYKNFTVDNVDKKVLVMYSLGNFFNDQTSLNKPKTQNSMIVNAVIERDASGKAVIKSASYTPTYIYRSTLSGTGTSAIYDYKILAPNEYATATKRPSVFANDAEWTKAKTALTQVNGIVKNVIPLAE